MLSYDMSTHTPSCVLCGCQCKQHPSAIKANDDDPGSITDEIARIDIAIRSLHALQDRQQNTICSSTRDLPSKVLRSMPIHISSHVLCGSPCEEHTAVIHTNNDPDSISDEFERLDKAVYSLRALRSERCRQLNSICSLTRTLPNEILLSVFTFFCSLFEFQDFPQFILGGVCNHWRTLINCAPLFWRKLNLRVWNLHKEESLLQCFKERNGASFEFIQLRLGNIYEEMMPRFQQFLQCLRGISTLQRISLYNSPVDLLQTINCNLDTRNVTLTGLPYIYDGLESIPGLSLPWSALTILKLSWIRVNFCFDLLLGCPNLIHFWCYDSVGPSLACRLPKSCHTRETSFPHLQYLTWYHEQPEWDDNLLSLYRFPALRHFHWGGIEHHYSLDLFHNFTSSLPPSCRVLQLSGPPRYDVRFEGGCLPHIEHPFERLVCSDFDTPSLSVVLEMLQDHTLLPSLTSFKWEPLVSCYMDEKGIFNLTRSLNNILRNRKDIGVGRFRIEIGGLESDECDRTEVYELMSGGRFHFEIAKNGDWIMSF